MVILRETRGDQPGSVLSAEDGFRCRVLVVDDNRDAADSLGLLLELRGHEVLIAHCATDALAMGQQATPEVIILDIGMPDMSGYEAARLVRQEAWGRRALLVAVTGWGQADDKEKARVAGFDGHFTKPVDPEQILRLVESFLNERVASTNGPSRPTGTQTKADGA
jgi:two-component system CheB/CheR fusion protein